MSVSRTIRSTAALAAGAIGLLGLTACGTDDAGDSDAAPEGGGEFALVVDGTLTACTDAPYPPFEFEDPEAPSGYSGFDIDLLQAIADELGLELAVENVSFDALQSGTVLAAGQCDVAASAITITPEREANLTFADPYYDSLQSLLVPADSGVSELADLSGSLIGVQAGTTGRSFAVENAPDGEGQLIDYPSDAELWAALQAGQVDAILQDLPVNLEHAQADADYVIAEEYATDEQYGLAFAGDADGALVDAVNEALATLRDNGTYDEIYDSYFSVN